MMVTIYVLHLTQGKYYVGKTTDTDLQLGDYIDYVESTWTKMYKPIAIIALRRNQTDEDLDKHTIKMMTDYGIENVRGGSFSHVELTQEDMNTITKGINSSENRCFFCHNSTHFIRDCPKKQTVMMCHRCEKDGHTSLHCDETTRRDGSIAVDHCYKCGREDHWEINCQETTDKYGNKLQKDGSRLSFSGNRMSFTGNRPSFKDCTRPSFKDEPVLLKEKNKTSFIDDLCTII